MNESQSEGCRNSVLGCVASLDPKKKLKIKKIKKTKNPPPPKNGERKRVKVEMKMCSLDIVQLQLIWKESKYYGMDYGMVDVCQ